MKAIFTAVFTECEEGGYHATIKEIDGINTQGETLEEAQQNLILAVKDHVSLLRWERERDGKLKELPDNALEKSLNLSFA